VQAGQFRLQLLFDIKRNLKRSNAGPMMTVATPCSDKVFRHVFLTSLPELAKVTFNPMCGQYNITLTSTSASDDRTIEAYLQSALGVAGSATAFRRYRGTYEERYSNCSAIDICHKYKRMKKVRIVSALPAIYEDIGVDEIAISCRVARLYLPISHY
jgi:hypothetical protein